LTRWYQVLSDGEIGTKEDLIEFIRGLVQDIKQKSSQVDEWFNREIITKEEAEESKNGLRNGDERKYNEYARIIKSR